MMENKAHSEALERFRQAEQHEHENRLLAEEDFDFLGGEQWPEEIRKAREQQNRPCLTFNRLPQFMAQVVGDARQNKPSIRLYPVDDDGDPEKAELLEGIIRHIESDSDADVAYLSGLENACGGGFGHWRVITEYCDENSFDQDLKIRRIPNPFSVYWDNNSVLFDKSDAEWCFVTEWITTEAFDRRYPKEKSEVRDWTGDHVRQLFGTWLDTDNRVRIAEYWCKKRVKKMISLMPDGQVVDGEQEGAIRTRETFEIKVVRYVLSGDRILEGPIEWPGKFIPIVTVFGPEEFFEGRCRYRSLVRYAKDPMRMYNYWQTSITEKIALAPKVPFIGTREQFKGVERFWDNINTSNKTWVPYNHDPKAPGPPQRTEPAHVQAAEINQAAQSIDDLKATIGIYDASLGNQGNETSGRAILARQREGDTSTYAWIDNLGRAIEHTGRILLDLIPRIYDSERVVRIVGEDDSQDLVTVNELEITDPMSGGYQINNDLSVGKYDVVVKVGPSYATKRLEAADSMLQFIQAYPAAANIAGDLIAKNMDWPGADDIAKRLKMLLPPNIQMQEASPEEQQELQAMMQPTPEQQAEEMKAKMEAMKLELDGLKAKQEAAKTAEEVEKLQLENIQKALEIQMQTEGFQQLLNEVIKGNLVQAGSEQQTSAV